MPQYSSRYRILIADDSADMQTLIVFQGHQNGWDVDYAADGKEAWEMYQDARGQGEPYDLLILDAAMPHFSGFMVAQKVRFEAADWDTGIAMFTAYDDLIAVPRCHELNADLWKKQDSVVNISELIQDKLSEMYGPD